MPEISLSSAARYITPEEYLGRERKAETKSEYLNGEIFAMSGGSFYHSVIIGNLGAEFRRALTASNCLVPTGDLRLLVSPSGLYTYPDVMVVCGEPAFADDRSDTITNAVVIVEVLSDSTKNYDRGEKFQLYRALPSLAEYLTVVQDQVHVEQNTRQPSGQWLLTEHNDLAGMLPLPSLKAELFLSGIYDRINISRR